MSLYVNVLCLKHGVALSETPNSLLDQMARYSKLVVTQKKNPIQNPQYITVENLIEIVR